MLDYVHNPTFQELPTQSEYFTSADEKIFIDLRRGKGYTNEIKELNRDDSGLSVTITLKNAAAKMMDCLQPDAFKMNIYTCYHTTGSL